jgi:hypothetical protein
MAYFTFLDENNIVIQVIEGSAEFIEGKEARQWYEEFVGKKCVETFPFPLGRKNFAGVGYYYDSTRDAFIPPKFYSSSILNEETCRWDFPVPMPTDGAMYQWVEDDLNWQEVPTE